MDAELFETIEGRKVRVETDKFGRRIETFPFVFSTWYKVFSALGKMEQVGVAQVVQLGSMKDENGIEQPVIRYLAIIGKDGTPEVGYGEYMFHRCGSAKRGEEFVDIFSDGFQIERNGQQYFVLAKAKENDKDILHWCSDKGKADSKGVSK